MLLRLLGDYQFQCILLKKFSDYAYMYIHFNETRS